MLKLNKLIILMVLMVMNYIEVRGDQLRNVIELVRSIYSIAEGIEFDIRAYDENKGRFKRFDVQLIRVGDDCAGGVRDEKVMEIRIKLNEEDLIGSLDVVYSKSLRDYYGFIEELSEIEGEVGVEEIRGVLEKSGARYIFRGGKIRKNFTGDRMYIFIEDDDLKRRLKQEILEKLNSKKLVSVNIDDKSVIVSFVMVSSDKGSGYASAYYSLSLKDGWFSIDVEPITGEIISIFDEF